jgi:hypothetical protein
MSFLKSFHFFAFVGLLVLASTDLVKAQESPVSVQPETGAVSDKNELPLELRLLNNIEKEIKKKKGKEIYERSSIPSLVFTPSQYALLREARIGFNTRAPTLQELAKAGDPNDPNYRPPASIRDIKLGGISFNTPDDWTIWLNSSRVTPDALPAEAIDLRVYKDFIELKWFDALTNQIYPVRLRTNQKFNIDSRIFLPG